MAGTAKFGVGIPNCREGLYFPPGFASPRQIVELAAQAERWGYDSVWTNDHYTPPHYVKKLWKDPPNFYEPLVTLSMVAGATRDVKLAAGVIVLPIRDPLVLAKQACTLDAFSGGRLILGVGLGAYPEEFLAANPNSKVAERPRFLEERLAALKLLLTSRKATFRGRYVNFQDVELFPRRRRGNLPVYIGGNAEKGIERAAKLGEGWIPTGLQPEELASKVRLLRRLARQNGRDGSRIEIAPQFVVCIGDTRAKAIELYKASTLFKHLSSLSETTFRGRVVEDTAMKNLTGTVDDVIDKVQTFIDAGVQHFSAMLFLAKNLDEYRAGIRTFAKEVLPSFKRKR
ncbi:MAG: LLM class flavin-dependent oxidoreductase [Nitrososphaerota archaeon]|nr:LLM class flavin-dependent oxidoreductase [Nitrososphaerota archaeon]